MKTCFICSGGRGGYYDGPRGGGRGGGGYGGGPSYGSKTLLRTFFSEIHAFEDRIATSLLFILSDCNICKMLMLQNRCGYLETVHFLRNSGMLYMIKKFMFPMSV